MSLAWAQLMSPITCEQDREQDSWRDTKSACMEEEEGCSTTSWHEVHCEKACPEVSTALSLSACRSQTSGSSPLSGLPSERLGLIPLCHPSTVPTPLLYPHWGKADPKPCILTGPAHWPRAKQVQGDTAGPLTQWGWGSLGCHPSSTSPPAFTWV